MRVLITNITIGVEKLLTKVAVKPFRVFFLLLFVGLIVSTIYSATPNPGHPWTGVGDGFIQFNTPTSLRTYTLPDGTSTIFTNFFVSQGDIVYGSAASTTSLLPKNTTATRYLSNTGASNNPAWAQVSLSNGVINILPSANGGTGNASTSFTGETLARTFTLPDANATIFTSNTAPTLAQGGTGANITPSNGGIIYSNASTLAILNGTVTAGQTIRSGANAAPSWSTAAYPASSGAAGQYLASDGTNWVSTAPATTTTVQANSYNSLGTVSANHVNSLTTFFIGLFPVEVPITVNRLSFSVTAVTTAGTLKACIYDISGTNKLIDITTIAPIVGTASTTLGAPVTLNPGAYYVAIGCATTCDDTVSFIGSTAVASMNGASVPAGKKVYEGTGTMTSGTCNTTLPTITGQASSTLDVRLDN